MRADRTARRAPLRSRILARLARVLEERGYPRLQMLLLVTITGGAGFLASYVFLRSGFDQMWLRYVLAVGTAYIFFLLLLWVWIRSRGEDVLDPVDMVDLIPARGQSMAQYGGQGGQYGGGGATGRFDDPSAESIAEPVSAEPPGFTDAANVADADEFAIPIVAILFAAAVLMSVFSIVYSAPIVMAELLLDGVLAGTLYHRLRKLDTRHWLESALRRTALPFAVTALILGITGWALNIRSPEATTLGQALGLH